MGDNKMGDYKIEEDIKFPYRKGRLFYYIYIMVGCVFQ